jgi:C1A family cysteine protease
MLGTDQTAIKTMIVNKHAVIVGLNIDNNFTNAKAGYTWNTIGDGNAPHGVIICGYDDTKNAYRILNSFGTSWGDAGYLWVDYSVFAARVGYYVYVLNY